jgi:hypothetical protein
VGTAACQIKVGSLRSSERLAKYNQLLRIAETPGIRLAAYPVPGRTAVPGRAAAPGPAVRGRETQQNRAASPGPGA